ncbi:MAG: porin [Pseudomonadota bacterium]
MARSQKSLLAFSASLIATAVAHGVWAGDAFAADPVEIDVEGKATVAAGLVDGETESDIDAEVRVRGSTVFQSGVEVGAVIEGRFDKQQPNQIYAGGRYTSLLIGGPRGVGPLTSDAFLESAYAYARGGFGEVIVGRNQGVARTLAVKAPTIFQSVNVNDWRTDLSGFNDIHTVNDFSGNSTKISYLPPANFAGGVIGGIQLGVSYAPTLADCGDDRCAPEDRLLITPDGLLLNESSSWQDVIEAALYYQKQIKVDSSGGLLVGFGASYVTADEEAQVASPVFGDYEAYSLGVNLGFRGITVGGSVKTTNAGLLEADDDNYLAFDAGITFKTGEEKGDWGFMLGYGRSEADMIGPNLLSPTIYQDTQTAQAGVTYFIGRGITIGAAAQFTEATRSDVGATAEQEEATTVVIESSIKF